jgi:hypothetical protein
MLAYSILDNLEDYMTSKQTDWTAVKVRSALVGCFNKHPSTMMVISQTDIGMPLGCLHQNIFELGVSLFANLDKISDVVVHNDRMGYSHVSFCVCTSALPKKRRRVKKVSRRPPTGKTGW